MGKEAGVCIGGVVIGQPHERLSTALGSSCLRIHHDIQPPPVETILNVFFVACIQTVSKKSFGFCSDTEWHLICDENCLIPAGHPTMDSSMF